jgi:hypothetical protein
VSLPAVAGAFLASDVVLVVAGAAKTVRPGDTAIALRAAGLPVGRLAVRVLAAAEVVLGAVAILVAGPVPGALVAVSYAGFAVFVALALLRHWPLASCGCLGRADSAPTFGHVAVDVGAAASAGWWALAGAPGIPGALGGQAGHGAALVVAAMALAAVTLVVLANPLARRLPPRSGWR